jgi:hypothetical protein
MSTPDSNPRSAARQPVRDPRDADEMREQIDATRADLGDTVEALAGKADIKARAKQSAQQARDKVTENGPLLARRGGAALAAAAGAALVAVLIRRRRAARRMTRWDRAKQTAADLGSALRDTELAGKAAALRDSDIAAKAMEAGAALRESELAGKAVEAGAALRDSELAAQAAVASQVAATKVADQARKAAASPDFKPRAQGAVGAASLLLATGMIRRRRARRRAAQG